MRKIREHSLNGEPEPDDDRLRSCHVCHASLLGTLGKGLDGIWDWVDGANWFCSTECHRTGVDIASQKV